MAEEHVAGEIELEGEHPEQLDPEVRARREAALRFVRKYGDPVLRSRAREVEAFDDDLVRLVQRMSHLMHDALGVGLAATQVDIHKQIIVIEASGLEARVIQHEMDHLDGVLILDRTSRDERKRAMRTLRESAAAAPAA